MVDRIDVSRSIGDYLVDGGCFSLTFDYGNPSRKARIGSPEQVHSQFVEPSGLVARGNPEFSDNGDRYLLHPFHHHPRLWGYKLSQVMGGSFRLRDLGRTRRHNDYTFGALFLAKR